MKYQLKWPIFDTNYKGKEWAESVYIYLKIKVNFQISINNELISLCVSNEI